MKANRSDSAPLGATQFERGDAVSLRSSHKIFLIGFCI